MKKFAVMLNNLYAFRIKESCTMTELCWHNIANYNDNVFELPLAKTNQRKKF
jgi:hypothetical protein